MHIYIYIYIYIHTYIYIYTGLNYNHLTATSRKWWLVREIIKRLGALLQVSVFFTLYHIYSFFFRRNIIYRTIVPIIVTNYWMDPQILLPTMDRSIQSPTQCFFVYKRIYSTMWCLPVLLVGLQHHYLVRYIYHKSYSLAIYKVSYQTGAPPLYTHYILLHHHFSWLNHHFSSLFHTYTYN